MKKKLFTLLFASTFLGGQNTNAQLPNGCIAPDFTATDINGNSWNLYSILAQGKTVFLDVSATWCVPCWSYHSTAQLSSIYNINGPPGTDEAMVFMIEGDPNTNVACLYGPAGCVGGTQGDWVTGTPYPIIDNAPIADSFQVAYYPTIFMITPDKICRENGQIWYSQHISQMQQYAFPALAANDAGINWACSMNQNVVNTGCISTVSVDVRLFNYSTNPLTSATFEVSVNNVVQQTFPWTGNVATYDYTVVTITGITSPSAGLHTAQIRITSVNGGTDSRAANDTTSIPFTFNTTTGGPPVSETFPTAVFPPAGWTVINEGSPSTWMYSTAGFNSAGSAKMNFYNTDPFYGNTDFLFLPSMSLTGYSGASLTFDRAHKMLWEWGDRLKIHVSVDCGATWITVYDKTADTNFAAPNNLASVPGFESNSYVPVTGDWVGDNIDLNSYLNDSSVIIKFEALSSTWGNNLYIDNVNLNLVTSTGEMVRTPVEFELYPNPATNVASVSLQLNRPGDVTIDVLNALGQKVQSTFYRNFSAAEHTFTINTENLSPGVYNVNIISAEGVASRKLVKE